MKHRPLHIALLATQLLWTAPALAADDADPAAPAVDVPAAVSAAAESALVVPGGRLTVRSFRTPGNGAQRCNVRDASIDRPIEGSGRYPVKLSGRGCPAWGWVEVKVEARALVTTRSVRAGESLEGAVTEMEREVRPPLRELATELKGARASRAIGRGQVVEKSHLEAPGAAPGSSVKVLVKAGGLQVIQSGRIVPCGRGRTCAVMPSGRHVEGALVDGRLIVEAL
jgi:hypothetical protein